MKKAAAIALFALGLFGIALFVTAVQMGRARLEASANETVEAVRAAQRSGSAGSSYIDWPRSAGMEKPQWSTAQSAARYPARKSAVAERSAGE